MLNLSWAVECLEAELDSMQDACGANPTDTEIYGERIDSVRQALDILREVCVCARCRETVIWIGGCPVCAGTEKEL